MWCYLFGSKLKARFDILSSVHLTVGALLDMFQETKLPPGLVFRVDWLDVLMEEENNNKNKLLQRTQVLMDTLTCTKLTPTGQLPSSKISPSLMMELSDEA